MSFAFVGNRRNKKMTKRVPIILLLMTVLTVAAPYDDLRADDNSSFQAFNYVIQISPDPNTGAWPIIHTNDLSQPRMYQNSKEFRYQITMNCPGVSFAPLKSLTVALPICPGATTVNYILGGAVQTVTSTTPCQAVSGDQQLWLISLPRMACGNSKSFSIFTSPETASGVVEIGMVTTSADGGCVAGQIQGPACPADTSTTEGTIVANSNGTESVVTYGPDGKVISVVNETTGAVASPVPAIWLCTTDSETGLPNNCYQAVSFGGASGTTINADPSGCCLVTTTTVGGTALVTCTPGVKSKVGCCSTVKACQ
jgi:hypothetical protein